MDIRRMSLIDTPVEKVSAASMDEYKCGADRVEWLENVLAELSQKEFWDPVYQAWRPYVDTYLSSGVNPELTSQYAQHFLAKEDWLDARPGYGSEIYEEILKLKNTSTSTVLSSFYYSDIQDFCSGTCKFFIGQRKQLVGQLHNPGLYNSTLADLLARDTWKSLMCAIVLYRHCQIDGFGWSAPSMLKLTDRLGEWLEKFLDTFDVVSAFVGTGSKVYSWYCPKVKEVLQRTWKSSLLIRNRPLIISDKDVYALTASLATKLVGYVNRIPSVYDDPFDEQTVWNSVSALFYPADVEAEDFCETAYKALCIPRSYFQKMCDNLYDFYWTVKDGLLSEQLYTRKTVEYDNGTNLKETPADYLESLYRRGFPSI